MEIIAQGFLWIISTYYETQHTQRRVRTQWKYLSSPVVINRIKQWNQSSRINCWNIRTDQIKTPTLINTTMHSCCKGQIRTTLDTVPFWIVSFRLGTERYQKFLCFSFELFSVISQVPSPSNLGYTNYFVKHLKSSKVNILPWLLNWILLFCIWRIKRKNFYVKERDKQLSGKADSFPLV